jgi:hypothetical protein
MQLQEPTSYDFCSKFQKAVQEGWGVSVDVDKYPQVLGNQFFATLIKVAPAKPVVSEAVADVAKEPLKQPAKKAKA